MGIWRRAAHRSGAVLVALALGMVLTTDPAGSQATPPGAFSNGQASATSQAVKVNPTAAALSIGITFGIALAGYQNEVAKAEARGIDLGIIGTTLAAEGCDPEDPEPTWPAEDQPQPLTADSREPDSAAGKTAPEVAQGAEIPLFRKSVRATPAPLAEAASLVAPFGQAGAVEIAGARSDAVTRVVDGRTREAVATAEIGSLDLGGGAVRLGNLKWTATHRTGAENTQTATFTVGSLSIGGVPLPVPSGDPATVFSAVNTVLAPLGIELRPPITREVNGAIIIDPLTVAVVPSATRDQVAGTLFNAIQPVREALVDAILALDCGNDTYVTVADIAIGSLTGAGSFSLELGGASANTGELQLSSFLGNLGGPAQIPAIPDQIIPGQAGTLGSTGAATTPPTAAVQGAGAGRVDRETAAPIAAATDGARGGKLAALAAATLLLLALVAELDRRKMRAALQAAGTADASPTTEA